MPRLRRGERLKNQPEPQLIDRREQVLDPMTAYQITSMMEGVVQGGTAIAVKEVGKPIAGKTGTTNDARDAWFIGFSPDIVVGIYLGYDKPRSLGRGNAAPAAIWRRRSPATSSSLRWSTSRRSRSRFRRDQADPRRLQDRHAGGSGRHRQDHSRSIQAGYRAPDNYSVIGVADADGRPQQAVSPDTDRTILRPGTGGLY